jgi:hypothetical protein
MLTFLTPLFLIGMLSAAIPLLIHLSRSKRTKKMRFSTTRFFTDQFLRSYRMSRLKELLLLACRMALCALFALALARPLLLPRNQSVLMGGGSRAVVVVLDNSASMGYVEDGRTMLDRARDVAKEVFESLGSNDTASVVLAGRRDAGPEVLFDKKPVGELGEVVQTVNGLQPAALGTDLLGAVSEAERIALASKATSKEVYVVSDMQETGFEAARDGGSEQAGSDVLFFFVKVRPKTVSNVAVTAVQYAAARPMVGVPFAIRPHLALVGEQNKPRTVRLFVDGQMVGERGLERLRSGGWAVPRFYHTFTTGGWHSGYLETQDETMPLDNRRYFSLEVLDSVKILAVNGAPSQVPRLDELFFLKAALTASPEGKSPFQIEVIGAPSLAARNLSDFPLVILANVESLSNPAVEKLEQFVDRGGNLLVFLGDKVNASQYNTHFAASNRLNGGLLPGQLLTIQGDPAGADTYATIARIDYEHPALAAFQDPKFSNFGGVSLKALWGMTPGASSAVLMRTNAGAPLLVERAFGKGRVVVFASTCDRDWTNFPVRPSYLPFTHRLVAYLAQEPAAAQTFYATGDAVPVPVAATEGLPQVQVKKPDGGLGFAVMN